MDLDQCPCSGKSLARLVQPAVMAVLAKRALHGYAIVQELGGLPGFHGEAPDPTGVYRVLKTMEDRGLVVSRWDLADAGPARRCYELTHDGRACLREWSRTLEQYRHAVTALLKLLRPTAGEST